MNKRIKELADQILPNEKEWHKGDPKDWGYFFSGEELEKFAELIVRECLAIARHREDELEDAGLLKESNAAGIVAYRIARQFGVKE
jgi:hypothetical protein